MTRRKNPAFGLFAMPQALVDAALSELTIAQRDALKAEQAARLMRLMIDTAEKVGAIVERADVPQTELQLGGKP